MIRTISLRKGNRREQAFYTHQIRSTPSSQTDWAAVDALTEQTIDYSDIPSLPDGFIGPVEIIAPKHRLVHKRGRSG